uniref:Uncharacterized protein n=1 Tax=Solanum lycopersicum TaxID=4081 RepID=K4D7L1_SOLLC
MKEYNTMNFIFPTYSLTFVFLSKLHVTHTKAIHKLEFSFGLIPNVRVKWKASVSVGDILNQMQSEDPMKTYEVTQNIKS